MIGMTSSLPRSRSQSLACIRADGKQAVSETHFLLGTYVVKSQSIIHDWDLGVLWRTHKFRGWYSVGQIRVWHLKESIWCSPNGYVCFLRRCTPENTKTGIEIVWNSFGKALTHASVSLVCVLIVVYRMWGKLMLMVRSLYRNCVNN